MILIDPADYMGRHEKNRKQPRKPLPRPLRAAIVAFDWLFRSEQLQHPT